MSTSSKELKSARVQEYQKAIYDTYNQHGYHAMGSFASFTWRDDPRHLLFSLARYKFCAKMLAGKGRVLEVGCGDGFGLPIMLQTVAYVHGVDNEPTIVEECQSHEELRGKCSFQVLDMTKASVEEQFEAAYSMDVIEHIDPTMERAFLSNISKALTPHGVCIVGTPNVTAAPYASDISNEGHINLKSGEGLRESMSQHFHNTFLFSMNDEVVHTGYSPMAHYVIVMGVDPKRSG